VYSAGIANNYTLNRLWTYSDSRSKRVSLQFLQFAVVSICGLLLNNAIVLLLTSWLDLLYDAPSASYLPAKLFATALVLVWTFTANRLWTFNDIR
jgi:putative flippase GtrA